MVNDRDCQIRLLTEDDIPSALALCRDSGWNQLDCDWRRLIRYQPNGCFAAVVQDKLAGTATTTSFGQDLAWIGMMLVDPHQRRRGIATRLLRHAIDFLRGTGVQSVKLDATPLGQKVYEQFGFRVESTFHRFSGSARGSARTAESDSLSESHHLLDERAFGASRRVFLNALAGDSIVVTKPEAFAMLRSGYLATYLGPIVASCPQDARDLVSYLLSMAEGEVFWDVLDQNDEATALAHSHGFRIVRELTRMSIGQRPPWSNPKLQYGIAGPAVG